MFNLILFLVFLTAIVKFFEEHIDPLERLPRAFFTFFGVCTICSAAAYLVLPGLLKI